ncbi:TetR/AcrR family transcriptional regulator [Pseudonocardia alaniniphila]|uniref:TetR/AcrR family transcriptional regulator n=1 Tax=Pseudonocardia alaniniphila TaxID=75291 RepID=A0ABS9TP64_9PSEU|nr:TetR/AcrR family transcriptional regulator [Pseudonocardia alaniniphila]MCH6170339.1 TetR/AcrR family transcriptional regulator [Pseudonocardia alaniniphila]
MTGTSAPAGGQSARSEGLRERKKRLTRDALARNAQRMFRERGFDQVTVAEIASSADVSVKTLFVYFASKEDLVFANENVLLDRIRERLTSRPAGTSFTAAVRRLAHDLVADATRDDAEGMSAFAALIGDNPALHSRLQLMWEHYEQALSDILAAETGTQPLDPHARAAAALLILPFRVLTSSDVRAHARNDRVGEWIDTCFDLVDTGLAGAPGTRSVRPHTVQDKR